MNIASLRSMKAAGLFILGCVLGLIGVSIYEGQSPSMRSLLHKTSASAGAGAMALACVPNSEKDDIFFISCGGVY